MKTVRVSLILAALCGTSALTLSAQPADAPHGRPPGPPVHSLMAALDLDGDGTLSATEIKRASKSLAALDTNSDGQLTPDELRPNRPSRRNLTPRAEPKNRPRHENRQNDGIGKEGNPAQLKAERLKQFDTDGDGTISPEEMQAAKAKRQEQRKRSTKQ